jgi:hypothetical protein
MVLGVTITPWLMVLGGSALLLLTAFQLASGMRWIKLGRRSTKIHRWAGISLIVLALGHGLLGIAFAFGLTIL